MRVREAHGTLLWVPGSIPAIPRRIVGFEREADTGVVVVDLGCGHRRHVRHRPPLAEFPWAEDDAAVAARIGTSIECLRCGQRIPPEGAQAYRRTATFEAGSIPNGLRRSHTTRDGVWGRLVVEQGSIELLFAPPLSLVLLVEPEREAWIPPGLEHHLRILGPVRLFVEFVRGRVGPGG